MNMDNVLALFTFASGKTLQVTMANKAGVPWVTNQDVTLPHQAPGFEKDKLPVVRIALAGEWPWLYTDFPVESVESKDGKICLYGPKGSAEFRTVDN